MLRSLAAEARPYWLRAVTVNVYRWPAARPANRAYHTLRGCEGMISCYDTVNVLATFRVGQTRVGGHIGEALRGGSQFGLGAGSTAVVRARMMDRLAPHYMLLTPPAKARVDEIVAPHDEMLKVDGHRSGEEVFLSLGAGRWHAVKRAAYGAGLISVDLDAVRRELSSVPWVDSVTVQRRWPRGLHVVIVEQVANLLGVDPDDLAD